jgi:hypothetical protein
MKKDTVTVFFQSTEKREERLRLIFTELHMLYVIRTGAMEGMKLLVFKHEFPQVVTHVLRYFGELTSDVTVVPF